MNGINLEIWFPQQDEVTVFLESSFDDADEELFYETSLFALYAARQIVNFRNDQVAQSLAATLMGIDETNPLEDVEARLEGDLRIGSPTRGGKGRKGFTAELRPDKRATFKLHPHGFGALGNGAAYYAPTSTVALLCWLLRRRADDPAYQRALGTTARFIGYAGSQGMLNIRTQVQVAMQATAGAWSDAMDEDNLPVVVDADVLAVAQEHGIDFDALYESAAAQLMQTVSEIDPSGEGNVAIPDWLSWGLCRTEVWMAVELGDDDERIASAFEAKRAAEESEDEEAAAAASAHYERVLGQALAAHGLAPVVQALHSRLFTASPDA
jgi:hypothetical protein